MLRTFVERCTRDGLGLVLDVSGLAFVVGPARARSPTPRATTGGAVPKMLRLTDTDTLFDDERPEP